MKLTGVAGENRLKQEADGSTNGIPLGRQMRANPARIARALRLAKRGLYELAWHMWTEEDEDWWVFRVRPCIQGETWDNARAIASYIFATFFRTSRTAANRRRDWSDGAHRCYLCVVNADQVI